MSATGQPPPEAQEAASTTETTETAAPAQPEGLDRLYERMDEMASQQRNLLEGFQQLTTPPEEEPDESLYYTDEGDLTEDGARAVIADLVREQVEGALAPREAARLLSERDDAYEALRDEYPELQDDKIAQPILREAIAWAQSVDPRIIERPEFVDVIERAYKASRWDAHREREAAEQPRPVVLESGQGAARAQRPNEPDWGARIVAAAEKLRPTI